MQMQQLAKEEIQLLTTATDTVVSLHGTVECNATQLTNDRDLVASGQLFQNESKKVADLRYNRNNLAAGGYVSFWFGYPCTG